MTLPKDLRTWTTAHLQYIDTTTNRAVVSIGGGTPVELPYVPGVYVGITTVFVILDPFRSGCGQFVAGPCYAEAVTPPAPPPAPLPGVPDLTSYTAMVRPSYTGTYRADKTDWDRFNTERYGGRSDLYQGSAYGSGTLIGFAGYESAVAALGALTISSIQVTVERQGWGAGSAAVTLQGSVSGTQPVGAPVSSGDTAAVTLTKTTKGTVTLTSAMCEAFRTGATNGLCLVGTAAAGVYGISKADGMVLAITYTRAL